MEYRHVGTHAQTENGTDWCIEVHTAPLNMRQKGWSKDRVLEGHLGQKV